MKFEKDRKSVHQSPFPAARSVTEHDSKTTSPGSIHNTPQRRFNPNHELVDNSQRNAKLIQLQSVANSASRNDNKMSFTQESNLPIQRQPNYGTFTEPTEDEIDRQNLSRLFEVDEAHDPTIHGAIQRGNQVTPAAFEHILGMYSAIRRGDTNFNFERRENPLATKGHKARAMGDIGKILQTASGRGLIQELIDSNVPIDITKAENPRQAFESEQEAFESYQNPQEHRIQVNYAPGEDILNADGTTRANRFRQPRGSQVKGTSDAILYHELVHAHHAATNTWTSGTLHSSDNLAVPADAGVKKEEYATVGLGDFAGGRFTENRYRAEQQAMQNTTDDRDKYVPRTSYKNFRRS